MKKAVAAMLCMAVMSVALPAVAAEENPEDVGVMPLPAVVPAGEPEHLGVVDLPALVPPVHGPRPLPELIPSEGNLVEINEIIDDSDWPSWTGDDQVMPEGPTKIEEPKKAAAPSKKESKAEVERQRREMEALRDLRAQRSDDLRSCLVAVGEAILEDGYGRLSQFPGVILYQCVEAVIERHQASLEEISR